MCRGDTMKITMRIFVKVIAFTVIAVLMTVGLGVKLANSRLFSDTYVLEAQFDDALGVLKGDAVKVAGVDVGRVESTRVEDGKAIVSFNIDRDVKLGRDSSVGIRWRNVVGQRFIYVYPGEEKPFYEEEDLVPAEQTRPPADIGEFLNRAGPILQAIHPEKANAFVDAINTALVGNEQTVRRLFDSGAVLAEELGANDEDISRLLESADTIMAAYANQDDQIGAFIDNLQQLSTDLAGDTDDINSLVENFAVVQEQLDNVLTRSRGNIDSSLRDLDTVAGTLSENRKHLRRTLRTLPLGVAGYFQTTSWGEWFNVRITKLLVRDRNSSTIQTVEETDNQHGDSGGGPGGGSSGGSQTSGPSTSQDLGSFIGFVLQGGE
ncbi:MAG: MCE family protein [Actinobacteria bacterium]|nr:MCE family protein [Actinomycetota bacterium]